MPDRHLSQLNRFRYDKMNLNRIHKDAISASCNHMVFTSFSPSILWALKTSKLYLFKNILFQMVAHGGIQAISGWRSRNPIYRAFDLKNALTFFNHGNLQYIALEQNISEEIRRRIPMLANNLFVVEHPLPSVPEHLVSDQTVNFDKPICFGFIGLASIEKGFKHFVDAARYVKNINRFQVQFWAVGRQAEYSSHFETLDMLPTKNRLDRFRFLETSSKLDFVCFPYEKSHYSLSPSGALLDAISLEKPIIASRFSTVDALCDKYGEIGLLIDKPDELGSAICEFVSNLNAEKIRLWKTNLRKIRQERSYASLATKVAFLR